MKSVQAGLVGAVLACVLWVVVTFVGPLVFWIVVSKFRESGAGMAGGTLDSNGLIIVALVGFALGYYRNARRSKQPR